MPNTDLALRTTVQVSVDRLHLDKHNPRLFGHDPETSDEAIIGQLYRREALDELLQSIAVNGYLDIEPLIVLANGSDSLTVLEGNRRLATIRLFRDPSLKDRIAETGGPRINVPELPAQFFATVERVSVYRVGDREEARPFIGFKHINGAAKWDPYAKARFATHWHETTGVSLDEIAERVGDKHDTVKRMVAGVYLIDQARSEGLYNIEDRATSRFSFSHLYSALPRADYLAYLGLTGSWSSFDPQPNPVPPSHFLQLRHVLVWIYGSKIDDLEPVVRAQNPDIKRLGEVIANEEAREVLLVNRDLDEAHSSTVSRAEKLSASLVHARRHLNEAVREISAVDPDQTFLKDIASDIKAQAEIVFERLHKSG